MPARRRQKLQLKAPDMFLFTPAHAQSSESLLGGSFGIFLPMILVFAIFYFLVMRPQQKKMKEHRDLVANVKKGDKIITNSGIRGKVTKASDETEVQVEIADGVVVTMMRESIAAVVVN